MTLDLADFEGRHEGEEVIVMGNGPGLKNIPFSFLESRPNFVLNYFAAWVPFIKPDYWLVLDPLCFNGAKYVQDTIKFVKTHQAREFKGASIEAIGEFDEEKTCFYQMRDRIPNFFYTEAGGTKYSTSAIAAAHLATHMGASKVLLIGIDCTYGMGLHENIGPDFLGLSRIPHFYDHRYHFTGYSGMWDEQWRDFAAWAEGQGTQVINLSIPTKSIYLPREDYRDYWEPEGGYVSERSNQNGN